MAVFSESVIGSWCRGVVRERAPPAGVETTVQPGRRRSTLRGARVLRIGLIRRWFVGIEHEWSRFLVDMASTNGTDLALEPVQEGNR